MPTQKELPGEGKKPTHRLTLRVEGRIDIEVSGIQRAIQLAEAFRSALKSLKEVEHKNGSAPKGALERRLEQLVI